VAQAFLFVGGGWCSLYWRVDAASFTVFVKGAGFDFSEWDANAMTGLVRQTVVTILCFLIAITAYSNGLTGTHDRTTIQP
jgi:hypothetical protein